MKKNAKPPSKKYFKAMNMGKVIRIHRQRLNLSQEALGAQVGVHRAAVQKWECGAVQNLKYDTIKRLATTFGVSEVELMGLSDTVPEPPPALRKSEAALLSAYRRLNVRGQSEAVKRVLELSGLPCYSSGS